MSKIDNYLFKSKSLPYILSDDYMLKWLVILLIMFLRKEE